MPDSGFWNSSAVLYLISPSTYSSSFFYHLHDYPEVLSPIILKTSHYAVVWNPWDKKAKALRDMGVDGYKTMLCVDSAAIENPIVLKPFEEWRGRQELSTVSSSYCSGQLDPRRVLHGFHWFHPRTQQRFSSILFYFSYLMYNIHALPCLCIIFYFNQLYVVANNNIQNVTELSNINIYQCCLFVIDGKECLIVLYQKTVEWMSKH